MQPTEWKTQRVGLTLVAIILFAAGLQIARFMKIMNENAFMSASPVYAPKYPEVKPTDITKAAQCAEGYDKKWVGCTPLAQ